MWRPNPQFWSNEGWITRGRGKQSSFQHYRKHSPIIVWYLDAHYSEGLSSNAQLLKNQTSAINSTINIIKQDEMKTKGYLNKILQRINQQTYEISEISTTQLIGPLSTHLAITATSHRSTESEIINVPTGAHNGRISPLLITPHLLRDELPSRLIFRYLARFQLMMTT